MLRPGETICQSVVDLPDFSSWRQFVMDTETSGVEQYAGDRICGLVIGPSDSEAGWYIPIRHKNARNLPVNQVYEWLKPLLSDENRLLVNHNCKYDIELLNYDGISVKNKLYDTMIAAHIDNGSWYEYALDDCTKRYLKGYRHERSEVLEKWLSDNRKRIKTDEEGEIPTRNYSTIPLDVVAPYALEDLDSTRRLFQHLIRLPGFQTQPIPNQGRPSWTTEQLVLNDMELVGVLAEIEINGIKVDHKHVVELRDKTLDEMRSLEEQIYKMSKMRFALSRWKLREDAFKACGGRVMFWNKPKQERGKQKLDAFTTDQANSTGRANWNAQALLQYLKIFKNENNSKAFEFIFAYKQWDQKRQAVELYLDAFLRKSDTQNRLHGQFHQHTVVTGRLSSSKPNLQNIAKASGSIDQKAFEKFFSSDDFEDFGFFLRDNAETELIVPKLVKDEDAVNRQIRSLIIPEKGKVLLSLDLSQIEYRVAVHYSGDERMIKLWNDNPKLDYHQQTCDDTGLDRDCCKIINFLILYGGGAKGLALTLTAMGKPTTIDQAKQMLNHLFSVRPALKRLMNAVSGFAERYGFIQNIFGRRCLVPSGKSYVGLNYLIQGTTGDWMRIMLVRIARMIKRLCLDCKIVSDVHDEIVTEMPAEKAVEYAPLIMHEMCDCPFLSVPVLADAEVGEKSWADAIPLDEWAGQRQNKLAA